MLYKIRQMKKAGEISKFFSDENGYLTVMVKKKEDGGKKVKVTYHSEGKNGIPKTLNEGELVELVRGKSCSWADMVERS